MVSLRCSNGRASVFRRQRRKRLLPDAKTLMGQSFHMQFLGNPGGDARDEKSAAAFFFGPKFCGETVASDDSYGWQCLMSC